VATNYLVLNVECQVPRRLTPALYVSSAWSARLSVRGSVQSGSRQRLERHRLAQRLGPAGEELQRANVLRQPLDDVPGA
jgi:hypothetical protein